MTNFLINNVRVVDAQKDYTGDIFIKNGVFADLSDKTNDTVIIDGSNKISMPGLFDPHVHFRDPGLTKKEDFHSGSQAAIAGGVTSFFDMPNTIPPTFTIKNLEAKRELAKQKSLANFGLFFGAGKDNLEEIKKAKNVPGIKLYLNTTTGDLKMDNENLWREIFRLGKLVALHAEGDTFSRAIDIWVEEKFPCHIHLCHASLKKEILKIKEVRQKYPEVVDKITVEVCPHHLFLTEKHRVELGNHALMKPELATKEDQDFLWNEIENGTINFFATDHAPHTIEDKEKGAFGISGVETLFPLIFTEFQKRNFDLKKFARMTSFNITQIFNIKDKKGLIEKGYDADCILIDPDVIEKINPEKFYSKAKWSPFANMQTKGKIEKVFIKGRLIFDKQFVDTNFRGQEINFNS